MESVSGFRYRADIDGLRALAVLLVVAYHAYPSIVPGGFIGVDVFFVISGFLVTGIVRRGGDGSRGSILSPIQFYVRRINRIFPALIVVLLCCLLAGWFLLFPQEYRKLGIHVRSAAGFFINFVFFAEAGYFDLRSEEKPLLHLWSLGVEEQFYLVWPLFFLLLRRWSVDLRKGVVAFMVLSFLLNLATVFWSPPAAFFLPIFRFWEMGAGGLIALLPERQGQSEKRRVESLYGILGVLLIIAGGFLVPPAAAYPGAWAIIPVLGAFLVVAAPPNTAFNRAILSSAPVVGLGLISYPLYLWHWPLLSLGKIVTGGTMTAWQIGGLVAAAFVLSVLTYRWIERPLRGARARPSLALALVGLLISVGVLGIVVEAAQGLPSRSMAQSYSSGLESVERVPEIACGSGMTEAYGLDLCVYPEGRKAPRLVIYGDSHAWRLFLAARELFGRTEIAMIGHTGGGLRTLDASDLVIKGRGEGSIDIIAYEPSDLGDDALSDLVDRLVAANHRVFLVVDNPRLVRNARDCLDRPLKPQWVSQSCNSDVAAQLSRLDPQQRIFEVLANRYAGSVTVIETLDLFCAGGLCPVADPENGRPMYDDAEHLNFYGAGKVLERLSAAIGSST